MRTIKTTAGTPVALDVTEPDVLAILEAISRDLSRRQELDYGFEDVDREIRHLVSQLTETELRTYLRESLFMSFNRFDSERMGTVVKKAARARETE
jgi:Ca2+-binding EF-hand superfamily protein